MDCLKFIIKNILQKAIVKESIFGALFTLWTAPIDEPKLDISKAKKPTEVIDNLFTNNLIVGQKP